MPTTRILYSEFTSLAWPHCAAPPREYQSPESGTWRPAGVYQMGELQARSLTTAGSGSGSPLASARWLVQRQVGFSSTRT